MNAKNYVIQSLFLMGMYPSSVCAQSPVQTPLTYEMLLPDFQKTKPSAATLGNYGVYEASEYTGAANIGVLLCEAHSGEVELPVALKYEASGIKVGQQASSVGLAWRLDVGGSIMHIVNGQDDFNTRATLTDKQFLDSIYSIVKGYHTAYVPQDYFVAWDLGLGLLQGDKLYNASPILYWRSLLMEDLAHGMHVPDVFHANFCGHSVSFVLDRQSDKVTVIDDNACKYKIEAKYNLSVWPEQFFITNDKGVQYVFKAFSEYDQLDSYYLTEIRGKNPCDVITISYSQHHQKGQYELYQSIGQLESTTGGLNMDLSDLLGTHSRATTTSIYSDAVYPSKIESRQEQILFELSSRTDVEGAKAIKKISVISKNANTQTQQVTFSYDYFHEESRGEGMSTEIIGGTDANYSQKRLKLIGLTVNDKKYAFSYDESVPLPFVTSLSQDYWGYYNGINNKNSFCTSPSYQVSGTTISELKHLGNANRLASSGKMGCGMLNKITYPTGGYSVLEYEPHHFDDAYYYPRAENPSCKVSSSISVSSVAAQKEKPNGESFILSEEKDVEITVNVNSKDPINYPCSATIWCAQGNNYRETFSSSADTPGLSRTFTRHLKAGVYVIYVSVPYIASDYTTTASISAIFDSKLVMDKGSSDASGKSIGGGLRIKSITNYDGKSTNFVGKTVYEYYGGKLLVPTVRRKVLTLNYTSGSAPSVNSMTYAFIGSQKSELGLMSYGIPNVGYSSVTKKNIEVNGDDNGYTVSEYENVPYQEIGTDGQFYYTNYGMNGRLLRQASYDSSEQLVQETTYSYGSKKYEELLFPKCTPLFMRGTWIEGCNYRLSIYTKSNVWNFLKSIKQTDYVLGKPMLSNETHYVYNDNNYKEKQVCTQYGSGVKTQKIMTYPDDRLTQGSNLLLGKHCLSEITSMDEYQGKKNLHPTGGFLKDFMVTSNGSIGVKNWYSKNTDGTLHLDMKVTRYDSNGNITEYITASGMPVTLLWSCFGQYPIMEIVGATYEEVVAASPETMQIKEKTAITEQELQSLHSQISQKTNGSVTAYLYNSWYKVSAIISPNGNMTHYEYDTYGRLAAEKDVDNHPISTYKYNYRQ